MTGTISGGVSASGSTPILVAVIDASVWISRLLPQDANHASAVSWVNGYVRGGGILTAPTVLAIEVGAAISMRTKQPADAHAAANQLYTLRFVRLAPIDQGLVSEAKDLAADLGLRGADALYVALARQLGIVLVSFDAEQLTLPSHLIQTIKP